MSVAHIVCNLSLNSGFPYKKFTFCGVSVPPGLAVAAPGPYTREGKLKETDLKRLVLMVIFAVASLLPASPWASDHGGWRGGHGGGRSYSGHSGGGHSYSSGRGAGRSSYSSGRSGRGSSYHSGGRGGGRSSYNGGYGRGRDHASYSRPSYNRGHSGHTTYTRTSGTNERRYHYRVGYRDGGSGYDFNFYRRGQRDDRNGYTGSTGPDNRFHRSDYEAYLKRINSEARAGKPTLSDYDVEPAAGPGAPRIPMVVRNVCGNWERANDACRVRDNGTVKWQPWMAMYE